jgi:hypothetical protein
VRKKDRKYGGKEGRRKEELLSVAFHVGRTGTPPKKFSLVVGAGKSLCSVCGGMALAF